MFSHRAGDPSRPGVCCEGPKISTLGAPFRSTLPNAQKDTPLKRLHRRSRRHRHRRACISRILLVLIVSCTPRANAASALVAVAVVVVPLLLLLLLAVAYHWT